MSYKNLEFWKLAKETANPRQPMTMKDLENKFNSLVSDRFNNVELLELKELIFNCEKLSAKQFMERLAVNG